MAGLTLHGYQERAVGEVMADPFHALFMDPGLGKTAISLTAFTRLRDELDVCKLLVIAPLRVCYGVWPEEARIWDEFKHLKVRHLTTHMDLDCDADIYTINPERLSWLFGRQDEVTEYKRPKTVWRAGPWKDWKGRPDMLVVDESSRFKTSTGVRTKTVKRYIGDFGRRLAMTGTPAANGVMGLHGQMLLVDGGAALDHRITYFQKRYFDHEMVGGARKFPKFTLKDGAHDKIMAAIAPRVTVLRAEDWLKLPEFMYHDVVIPLEQRIGIALTELEHEAATEIDDIELINDGPALTKIRQLVNGIVYETSPFTDPSKRKWKVVHREKLNALTELLDEIGKPAIVTYEFLCEREEIVKTLRAEGFRVAIIGGGISAREGAEAERAWNAGELDVLLVHPAAAGHGLNLQRGGHCVIWFAPIWDLELYQQLNGRVRRQGQESDKVFVYHLVGRGTPDRRVARVLRQKDATQESVFDALKREE